MAGHEATLGTPAHAPAAAHFAGMAHSRSPFSFANLGLVAFVTMFLSTFMWAPTADHSPRAMGNYDNLYRIALVLLAALLSAFALLRDPRSWPRAFPGPLLLLMGHGALAMISSAFIPEQGLYCLWKGFEIIVFVLAAAAMLGLADTEDYAHSAYRAIVVLNAVLVVVFAIEAIVVPEQALQPQRGFLKVILQGVLPVYPENAVAFLGGLTAYAMFTRMFRESRWTIKWLQLLLFLVACAVLVLAQSRTSFVATCVAFVCYLVFDRRFKALACLTAVVLLAGVFASFFDVFYQYLLRGQDPELVRNLSGRTAGWAQAVEHFELAPILGHGFVAYARMYLLSAPLLSSMHGAVFEVMVGTGGLGLLFWGGGILWALARLGLVSWSGHPALRTPMGRSVQAEMLGLTVFIVLRAATSSGLAQAEDNFMLLLALIVYTEVMRRGAWRIDAAPTAAHDRGNGA